MKKHMIILATLIMLVTGCNTENTSSNGQSIPVRESAGGQSPSENTDINSEGSVSSLELTADITQLEKGLSAVKYTGDYGFEEFLANG